MAVALRADRKHHLGWPAPAVWEGGHGIHAGPCTARPLLLRCGGHRADFATDEEWQRYKETRETLPRAAFQFGMKRADGRKSHKELEKGTGKGQVGREVAPP